MYLPSLPVRRFLITGLSSSLAVSSLAAPGTVVEWGLANNVPPGTTGFSKIAGGRGHLLGLRENGQQTGWSTNGTLDLGVGSNPFGGTLTQLAAGDERSAGLWSDGRVTWSGGFNFNNWMNVTAIAMGGFQTVARFSDGTVAVDGGTAPPAGLTNVTAVAAGPNHALALQTGGTVTAWGANFYGQRDVPAGLSGVTAIAAGENHSLALLSNGTVVAWGAGKTNGAGPDLGQSIVPPGLSGVTAIAAGYNHSVALKSDGTVVCWGDNSSGQCTIPPAARNVQSITAGQFYTAAIVLPAPDIVMGVDNRIVPGGFRHDFLTSLGAPLSRTFFIVNYGTAALTGLAVTRDGPDAARFTVSALPQTSLAQGQSTTFTVTFQPDAARACLAELHIASNDPDQPAINYVLTGRTPMGAVTWGPGRPDYFLDQIPVAAGDIVDVESHGTYSAVVHADGRITAWGADTENPPNVWHVPAQAGRTVVDAAISDYFFTSVVLTREGAVHGWLPRSNTISTAAIVPASAACRQIAAGGVHYLVLKGDGTLTGGGENTDGQLTIPPVANVQDIAAGAWHSVALLNDGSVMAWGKNNAGQCTVPPGLRAVDIAAGNSFTVALLRDRTVTGWGNTSYGPFTVPAGLTDVVSINAGGETVTAIKRDGSIVVIGNMPAPAPAYPRPAAVTAGGQLIAMIAPAAEIDVSQQGTAVPDGTAFDFGYTSPGQPVARTFTISNTGGATATLTNSKTGANTGDFVLTNFPASLASGASTNFTITFTPAAAGPRVAALQIGSSDPDENPYDIALCGRTPMNVSTWGIGAPPVPQGLNDAIAVAAGSGHSLALRSNGTVVAWGGNEFGQATVPPGLTNVTAIAAGGAHSLALRSNGTVVHWGSNPQSLPAGLTGVKAIAAGFTHSLALKTDNTIAAWGTDVNGEVAQVQGLTNVHSIAAGYGFSLWLGREETIGFVGAGAGANTYGQCLVIDAHKGLAVTAGFEHGAMLMRDATVRGWGRNHVGQATVPSGLSGVRFIDAGDHYTLALKNDGTLAAWGMMSLSSPTAPTGYGAVGGISAGSYHVLALTRPFPAISIYADTQRLQSGNGLSLASAGGAPGEPRTLTVFNDGAAPLTGLAVSTATADAASFIVTQPSLTTLAPGAFTTFTVQFVPGSTGAKNSTLRVVSNDPDENPLVINLTGSTDFTPIQAWRWNWFGNSQNADVYANLSDYEGDTVPNMLEFAFGTNPLSHNSGPGALRYTGPAAGPGTLTERGHPAVLYEKNGAVTTFRGLWIRRKNHAAAGLVYTPEFAANPNTWSQSATAPQVLASDAFYDVVAVTFPASVTGGAPKYFRVRVAIPNPD